MERMAKKRSQTRREVIVSEWKEYKLGEIITTNAKALGKIIRFLGFLIWIQGLSLVIK